MGISYSTDQPPADVVKSYCESVIFIKFNGQTNSMTGHTDEHRHTGSGDCQTDLGFLLKELDAEVRAATSPSEFEITDKFRAILRRITDTRCNKDVCESEEHTSKRLVRDAERFRDLYRHRNTLSESLIKQHEIYWGTRQQLLFGKVVADWIDRCDQKPNDEPSTDPIFGVLLNPTGGRVGPGDTGWFHNTLFDDYGPMAYHSAVHDGFGYLKTNHNTGPGYDYVDGGWLLDSDPLAGQICGISFWRSALENSCPESHLDKFRAV